MLCQISYIPKTNFPSFFFIFNVYICNLATRKFMAHVRGWYYISTATLDSSGDFFRAGSVFSFFFIFFSSKSKMFLSCFISGWHDAVSCGRVHGEFPTHSVLQTEADLESFPTSYIYLVLGTELSLYTIQGSLVTLVW